MFAFVKQAEKLHWKNNSFEQLRCEKAMRDTRKKTSRLRHQQFKCLLIIHVVRTSARARARLKTHQQTHDMDERNEEQETE